MSALSLRLPDELEDRLEEETRAGHRSRSEVVREALAEYLTRREKERFMDEMFAAVRELAGSEEADRESRALGEAFLPLENEALGLAEGRGPGDQWPAEDGDRWWT